MIPGPEGSGGPHSLGTCSFVVKGLKSTTLKPTSPSLARENPLPAEMQFPNLNMSADVDDPLAGLDLGPREIVIDGAQPLTNSLAVTSLESMSFRKARERQMKSSAAPDRYMLAAKLGDLSEQKQGGPVAVDLSLYRDVIESDLDPDNKRYALLLASLRTREAAERIYAGATRGLREMYNRQLALTNRTPWLDVFEAMQLPTPLTATDRELLKGISQVRVEYFPGNLDLLDRVLLQGAQDSICAKDLPGFVVVFTFTDLSELSSNYHFDLENPLLLQSVDSGIVGKGDSQAAAALSSLGDKYQGLFAIFTPPTAEDLANSATDEALKGTVQAELQMSMAIAQAIKAHLMA